ncbi:MAG: nitroreductase family protein [Oscillospiraceae bacterium]
MNYSALIQNRKSVREFADKKVPAAALAEIEAYYQRSCQRLIPGLETKLCIFGEEAREALEGAAGYERFLIGAPNYMILLSAGGDLAGENAGYMMEDMVLKLTDMDLGCCWITFTDSERVKAALKIDSPLDVAAIVAFGQGVKTTKRLRINILSMSNVDISAKRQYFAPKHGLHDMVFMDTWGNCEGVDEYIGFYDDMLWEALYAAAQSPSYLNRQPYGFVIHEGRITLVKAPDSYTGEIDAGLGLGIVLLHFTATASRWAGRIQWSFGADADKLQLPEGYEAVASCKL